MLVPHAEYCELRALLCERRHTMVSRYAKEFDRPLPCADVPRVLLYLSHGVYTGFCVSAHSLRYG